MANRLRASRLLLYRPEEPNCLPKPSCSVSIKMGACGNGTQARRPTRGYKFVNL